MNKFKQVFSDGYQMSLSGVAGVQAGGGCPMSDVQRGLMSDVQEEIGARAWRWGVLYSEIQCIKSNSHMGTPPVNRQTRVKTLPSRNSVDGR